MASMQQGDGPQSSFTATTEVVATSSAASNSNNRIEEPDHSSSNWYFPREYIEKNSPSRKDGIDLKKETYFRKSYCTFLQDLGMRLKVPQITIATAIVFCHRFFLRQSHSKNDRYLIATTCMFLAGKVEETPQKLCDVIFISYEIRNKKDPNAVQRIKQKEVYEQQKELVLLGERLVLATLGFDLNIHHPYRPLVNAIKKFKVAQNALAQVAWNFVNDGLRTSLCLQFKPHHIAAGAIFLAAKFLKVKLPNEGEKVWWQEFDVTPRQLEEVSNQMLELYEQNREAPSSRVSDASASVGTSNHYKQSSEVPAGSAVHQPEDSTGDTKTRATSNSHKRSATEAFHSSADRSKGENEGDSKPGNVDVKVDPEMSQASTAFESGAEDESKPKININGNMKPSTASADAKLRDSHHPVKDEVSTAETPDKKNDERNTEDIPHASETKTTTAEDSALKRTSQQKSEFVDLADVNIDRVKAAIQRRKMGGETRPKRELTDEEELLEMELENGRKDVKQERVQEHANNKENTHRDVEYSDGSQEFEGKQHISKEIENGEGKHHRGYSRHNQPQHHHNQHRFDSEMERHQRGEIEKQERDYKKPRIDYRK